MKALKTLFLAGVIGLFYSCGPANQNNEADEMEDSVATEEMGNMPMESEQPDMAVAVLSSASESTVTGTATFTANEDNTVKLVLKLENANPGTHAVHLHQKGDCSAPDAKSAGGHWNPSDEKHGKRASEGDFHSGDIDNVEVGEDGTGSIEMDVQGWTIGGADSTNVIDHAVIVHAGADDFTSQPSGAAGARVACGVIQMEN